VRFLPTEEGPFAGAESRSLFVAITPDALHSLSRQDIEEIAILEDRSAFVEGEQNFYVVAEPSKARLNRTQALRDSFPYDNVAWLSGNKLVAIPSNINAQQLGASEVAQFFGRSFRSHRVCSRVRRRSRARLAKRGRNRGWQ